MSGSPIPTLGYPSRTAACVALRRQGLTNAQIGQRVGIAARRVSALLLMGDRALARAAERKRRVAFKPPAALDRRLRPYAARRNISVDRLIARLLETLLADAKDPFWRTFGGSTADPFGCGGETFRQRAAFENVRLHPPIAQPAASKLAEQVRRGREILNQRAFRRKSTGGAKC